MPEPKSPNAPERVAPAAEAQPAAKKPAARRSRRKPAAKKAAASKPAAKKPAAKKPAAKKPAAKKPAAKNPAAEKPAAESDAPERFDLLLIPENPSVRVHDGLAGSVIRYLATTRVLEPVEEALHKDWVEVYCKPGASAHEPFVKGAYQEDAPPFLEACVRWSTPPTEIPTGGDPILAHFVLEFRGCLFREPLGPFRKKFKDLMRFRPHILVRPHAGLPPHREVAPEDAREETKRLSRGSGGGLAGTRVEEW